MEIDQKFLELLERIESSNRKQTRYARLQFILSFTAAGACLVLIFAGMKILPQLRQIIMQTETVLTNLETVTTELASADLPGMVSEIDVLVGNVDELVSTSQTGVEQAIAKINAISFDQLNEAIKDLSDVIEPIAKFFKSFKFG